MASLPAAGDATANANPANEAPRRSATVLVVRDAPLEVLMVTRHAAATFASALVFPGGAIDLADGDDSWFDVTAGASATDRSTSGASANGADRLTADERALRVGAIRETWEEASILLAAHSSTDTAARRGQAESRDVAELRGLPLRTVLDRTNARLDLDELVEFAHWVTPAGIARRFDTWFFIAAAPPNQPGVSDGVETVGLEWITPARALAAEAAGERSLVFPTLMNLRLLAESSTVAEALEAARARAPFTVHPRREVAADGQRMLVVDPRAGYPVRGLPERTLHGQYPAAPQ